MAYDFKENTEYEDGNSAVRKISPFKGRLKDDPSRCGQQNLGQQRYI